MARALINVPAERQARRGHRDQDADLARDGDRLPPLQHGAAIPRDIITPVRCTYNGEEIFSRRALSGDRRQSRSSPFTRSPPRAARSTFNWTGDNGFAATEEAKIVVE